jgi:hypothetical protein
VELTEYLKPIPMAKLPLIIWGESILQDFMNGSVNGGFTPTADSHSLRVSDDLRPGADTQHLLNIYSVTAAFGYVPIEDIQYW